MKSRNWRAYFYVFKTQVLQTLAYRADVFGNILGQCIVLFATAFFWKALFTGHDAVKGVVVDDMLVYTIISSCMSIFFTINVEYRVSTSVRKGTVATDMLKPINLFGIYFFEDLGNTCSLFFQNILPILIIGSIFIKVPSPAGLSEFLLFIPCVILSYLINWVFAACYSTLSFVTLRMGALGALKFHMIRLLSGSVIPMWFFPEWLQAVLNILPFAYIYQLPLDIYIGKVSIAEALPKMGLQLMWLILLYCLFLSLQRVVTKHVMVQGG